MENIISAEKKKKKKKSHVCNGQTPFLSIISNFGLLLLHQMNE